MSKVICSKFQEQAAVKFQNEKKIINLQKCLCGDVISMASWALKASTSRTVKIDQLFSKCQSPVRLTLLLNASVVAKSILRF